MSDIEIPQLEISEETDFKDLKAWYDLVFADPSHEFRYLSYIELTDISSSPDVLINKRPSIQKLTPEDPVHFNLVMRSLVDKLQKNVCKICPNYEKWPVVIDEDELKEELLLPKQAKEIQTKLKEVINQVLQDFAVEISDRESEGIREQEKEINKKKNELISEIDKQLGSQSQIGSYFSDFSCVYYQLIKENKELTDDTLDYVFWQKYKENESFKSLVDKLFLLYKKYHILYLKYEAMCSGVCIKGSELKDILIQNFGKDFAEKLIDQASDYMSRNSKNIENEYIGNNLLKYIERVFPTAWQTYIAPILQKELKEMREKIAKVF